MFYKLYSICEYDKVFKPFIENIKEYCSKSEFQFLENKKLYWEIPNSEDFEFEKFYYIEEKVLVFNKQIWDNALSIIDLDEVFQIPVVIEYRGEKHYYTIVVPSRIDCLDQQGRILKHNVGRYHIFKTDSLDDNTIYISSELSKELETFN